MSFVNLQIHSIRNCRGCKDYHPNRLIDIRRPLKYESIYWNCVFAELFVHGETATFNNPIRT